MKNSRHCFLALINKENASLYLSLYILYYVKLNYITYICDSPWKQRSYSNKIAFNNKKM